MEEINNKKLDQILEELSDILLVFDKERKKIEAVKGIDQQGNLQTVPPQREHRSEFMRVDKHGNIFSNFFSNFLRQLKNPTRFSFFKVPADIAPHLAKQLQQQITLPTEEGKKEIEKYEVKGYSNDVQKNKDMETTKTTQQGSEYRYQPEQLDWDTLSNLGLSKERLEKLNLLDPLLKGYKTNELVAVSINLGTAVTKMDARLSLRQNDNGEVAMVIHGVRKEPELNYPFFGHEFSKEDKDNLRKTGNMGRIVNLTNPKNGENIPSFVSVDRLTNELIALRAEKVQIPDEIKGVKLTEEQKQTLLEGKPLYLEGMISKKNTPFSANIQFNADKRYVEFLFDRNALNQHIPVTPSNNSQEVPRTFRGKTLTDEQYNNYKDGQTVGHNRGRKI